MKRFVYIATFLAVSAALAAANAQTTGDGVGIDASAGAGAGAATQQGAAPGQATNQQSTGVDTQQGQLNQQGTAQPQGTIGGQAPLGIEAPPGVQPQQDVRFRQHGQAGTPYEDSLLRQSQPGERSMLNGQQRAELGVWLTASGGPGVEIRRITPGSAAEVAGLQPGDVLLEVNERPVVSPLEVQQLIRGVPAGEVVMLEVLRDGVQQQVSATLSPGGQVYQSAFRGNDMGANGDLVSRTMRLEQQLGMVIQELRQLREEMAQLRSSSQATTGVNTGIDQGQALPAVDPFEQQPPVNEFDQLDQTTPAPLPAEPEAQPAQPETEQPATEQPAEEFDEDLFGTSATESEAEAETPPPATETETETEAEPTDAEAEAEADSDEDSLFN